MRFSTHRLVAFLLSLAVLAPATQAQPRPTGLDERFPAGSIAPQFRFANGSGAVVRLDSRQFEVEDASEATLRVRRVVTVLSPEGRAQGQKAIHYDTFRKVKNLDGHLLDAEGEVIRRLDKDDVGDRSAISGISLYEENRLRTVALYHNEYPYTVVIEYVVAYDGFVNWPTWVPQRSQAPVEHALFEIDTPQSLPARYAARRTGEATGVSGRPETSTEDGRRRYRWSASGLSPRVAEPRSPSWSEQRPLVRTAPAVFEFDGRRGTMDSWQVFGQWVHDLNAGVTKGEGALPPEARAKARELVEGAESRREKVRRLYRYMQEQTRYVSVQLGIGGMKAFSPAYVAENSYGDCKALVYFMQALLAEVGIASHPALVLAGRRAPEVPRELPSNLFNHVILAVPMPGEDGAGEDDADGDRLWLECTSQTSPFAHLGAFTEDRHALLVKDGASELVRLPANAAAQNAQHRRAHVRLTPEGHATADVATRYTGNQQDRVRARFGPERTDQERRDYLRKQTGLSNVEILSADFAAIAARHDTARLPMRLNLRRYGSRTGSRLFFQPNLLSHWTSAPSAMDAERTQPVAATPYPFVDTDTLVYTLPEGFAVEALPDPVSIETPFGYYEASLEPKADGTLEYRRRIEMRQRALPKEQYEAFRAFMQRVTRADRAQVVLVKH